jgi:hypothetical protein
MDVQTQIPRTLDEYHLLVIAEDRVWLAGPHSVFQGGRGYVIDLRHEIEQFDRLVGEAREFTAANLAAYSGTSGNSMSRWIKTGVIPKPQRIGGRKRGIFSRNVAFALWILGRARASGIRSNLALKKMCGLLYQLELPCEKVPA